MKLKYTNSVTAGLLAGLAAGIMVTAYMKEDKLKYGFMTGAAVFVMVGGVLQIGGFGAATKEQMIAGK